MDAFGRGGTPVAGQRAASLALGLMWTPVPPRHRRPGPFQPGAGRHGRPRRRARHVIGLLVTAFRRAVAGVRAAPCAG